MSPVDAPASLRARFELTTSRLVAGGREYELLKPRSVDELISEEDFAIDERIPYWADCWPSARVLAERVSGLTGGGRDLLELGCGIGLVAIAAASAGFRVLATDYYSEALEFTEANATRNGVENVDTRLIDWRRLPDDLGTFDVVLAADVLYERPQAALVANVLAQALSPGGFALITDPGRRTAPSLIDECSTRGLAAVNLVEVPMVENDTPLSVWVYEVRRI